MRLGTPFTRVTAGHRFNVVTDDGFDSASCRGISGGFCWCVSWGDISHVLLTLFKIKFMMEFGMGFDIEAGSLVGIRTQGNRLKPTIDVQVQSSSRDCVRYSKHQCRAQPGPSSDFPALVQIARAKD